MTTVPSRPAATRRSTVNNPAAGTWYVMVRGYSDYAGVTLKASYGDVLLLQDGVPVQNLAGALNSETYLQDRRARRPGHPAVQHVRRHRQRRPVHQEGQQADDLRVGTIARSRPNNTESISIGGDIVPGTWYVMLKGTAAYSGVTLLADYSVSNTVVTLTNGVPVTDISGSQGGAKYYKIEVPAGQTKLEIAMSGGTGDADLYVRRGSQPTTAEYDYRPYLLGNDESVTVNNPTAGTWFIMIRGYQAFSGITLLATYGGGTIPDEVTTLQNGVAVTGLDGRRRQREVLQDRRARPARPSSRS